MHCDRIDTLLVILREFRETIAETERGKDGWVEVGRVVGPKDSSEVV